MSFKDIGLLGFEVKDRVTKFSGIVTSVSFDLFGCVQAFVRPFVDKDGKIPEGNWFDTNRLEKISKTAVMDVPDFLNIKGPEYKTAPRDAALGL